MMKVNAVLQSSEVRNDCHNDDRAADVDGMHTTAAVVDVVEVESDFRRHPAGSVGLAQILMLKPSRTVWYEYSVLTTLKHVETTARHVLLCDQSQSLNEPSSWTSSRIVVDDTAHHTLIM